MSTFTVQSDLAVDPVTFWVAMSIDSVNWELAPFARMTAPREWRIRPLVEWEAGRELFRSWILLCGFIPVDRHAFFLEKQLRGSGFLERSSSWMNRQWNHQRTIVARAGGCTVIDRVSVVGRIPLVSALAMPIYRFIFHHRHRRLRKKYPLAAGPPLPK